MKNEPIFGFAAFYPFRDQPPFWVNRPLVLKKTKVKIDRKKKRAKKKCG